METQYLAHYGVKKQRWGYRRWQNPDGTLTEAGKEHYGKGLAKRVKTHREKKIREVKSHIQGVDAQLRDPKVRGSLSLAKKNATEDKAKYLTAASNANKYRDKADNSITFTGNWINNRRADKAQREAGKAYRKQVDSEAALETIKAHIAKLSNDKIESINLLNQRSDKFIRIYSQEEYDKIFKK